MLLLDEPYVSPLLLETAEKNRFSVLENDFVEKALDKYNLNLLCDNSAKTVLNIEENPLVYSNSENSLNWIFDNFGNSELAKNIRLFKNKTEFRKVLSSIYPDFFFKEYDISELEDIDINSIPKPFIIKPSVGFLSLGVYTVTSNEDWTNVLKSIKNDSKTFSDSFPEIVVNSSKFIIEEFIKGEEFAIDAFYSQNGEPVILNIFKHPFVTKDDVSDRIYITSKEIIQDNIGKFTNLLSKIGEMLNIKAFPIHMEVRVSKEGKIVPIEINPMRFAGWCTTDVAYFAYGINVYEYYFNQLKPDWSKILNGKDGEIYYFSMIEKPSDIDKNSICNFDYEGVSNRFSKILEFRKIDYKNKNLFAVIFGKTSDANEINEILKICPKDFIKFKEISSCK